MSPVERRAWFYLAIVFSCLAVWLILFAIWNSAQISMAAFALLGFTGIRRPREALSARDHAIAESSLNMGIRCWLVCATIIPIAVGSFGGWDRAVSIAIVAQGAWLAWLLILMVQAVATLYLSIRTNRSVAD